MAGQIDGDDPVSGGSRRLVGVGLEDPPGRWLHGPCVGSVPGREETRDAEGVEAGLARGDVVSTVAAGLLALNTPPSESRSSFAVLP